MVMREFSSKERHRGPTPLPKLVYEALVRAVGPKQATVVDFYVDSRLAALDPESYERALENLLGRHGGRLVFTALRSELARSGRAQS
jgi:hypothetical protein